MSKHNMIIHEALVGLVNSKSMFKLATKLGLNKIDFNKSYILVKQKSKNDSGIELGYETVGKICLIGNGKTQVAIYINSLQEWFQTSAIVKCRKVKAGFKLTTLNSIYLLKVI